MRTQMDWRMMLASAVILVAAAPRAGAQASRNYLVYEVQITGPAIGGVAGAKPFNRVGSLYLTKTITTTAVTGDVNGVDFFLKSGSPAGSPDAGALRFATNSLAVRDGSAAFRGSMIDLATTCKVTGSTVTAAPSATLTRQYLSFSARSGLTASLYMVESGSVSLGFNADMTQLTSGTIALSGRAAGYPTSTPVLYQATITGRYLGMLAY